MINRALTASTSGHITCVVIMDIKAAIPSVANGRLINAMKVQQRDGDLIQCT